MTIFFEIAFPINWLPKIDRAYMFRVRWLIFSVGYLPDQMNTFLENVVEMVKSRVQQPTN